MAPLDRLPHRTHPGRQCWISGGVTDTLNHDLAGHDPIKDKIGVRKNCDSSKAALPDSASRPWMRGNEFNHSVDATLDVSSA